MALADRIAARTRRPTATVKLDGRTWRAVLTIATSAEYGQGLSSLQLAGRDPPTTPVAGMPISVRWGYDGFEVAGFTGSVVVPERQSYPNHWSLQCIDALWPAQRENQPIQTSPLNDITAKAAIEYILATYAGITRVAIPDIQRPAGGGSWTLGQLTPVSWESAITALAACQEIAQTAGYWLYADAGGTVRARQLERRPSDSPFRVLTGGDAAGATLLVSGAPVRRQDANQVKNRITVRGANTGVEGAQLYDTFVATHALLPGVENELEYQTFLLEFEDDVTAVAQRIAGVWNRVPDTVTARIKADPRLSVGTTVAIRDPNIGFGAAKNFFIYRLNTSLDLIKGKFDQEITLDGGLGDAGFSTIPPPVAVATYQIETETLDGTAVAVVRVDGSASYSQSAGEIVAWAWSTSSTPYSGTPSSATGVTATFVFALTESPVTISLTVTDTSSKTDTLDLVIDLAAPDVPATTEGLNVAFGAAWEATADGGATWGEYVGTTTRVPPIGAGTWDTSPAGDADTYGLLASGGTLLRQSLDVLASTPTTRYTAGGSITALSANAKNAARVWIAVGDTVYRSIDGGATFTSWGTPVAGVDVVDILEDPALDNSVFCLAGPDMYQSLGPAGVWGVLFAGPAGATARWMQRSESGTITWICYTGTFTGSPLARVEGPVSVSFPVVSPDVTEVRAIALLDAVDAAAPLLVAVDQEARIWQVDGLTGAVLAQSAATFPAGAIAQHAAPSQQLPLVYIADFDSVAAGTGAVRKYFPEADSLLLFREGASGRQAHMVGLTGVARQTSAKIIQLPWGASGAADKLFVYSPDTGLWTAIAPPKSGWYWTGIVANPFNGDQWLLLGNTQDPGSTLFDVTGGVVQAVGTADTPLYYTADAGATWQPVTLTHPWETNYAANPFSACYLSGATLGWSESTGGWVLYGSSDTVGSVGNSRQFWYGSGASASSVYEAGDCFGGLCIGQAGEALIVTGYPTAHTRYVHADGSTTDLGSTSGRSTGRLDREPGTRRMAWSEGFGTVFITSDYQASAPVEQPVTGHGSDYAWATHGLYTARGVIPALVNPATGGLTPLASYPSFDSGSIRVDRQTRSLLAWRQANDTSVAPIWIYDGTTLSSIPGPAAGSTLANWIEVIGAPA